jgi:hypothetical protein
LSDDVSAGPSSKPGRGQGNYSMDLTAYGDKGHVYGQSDFVG